MPEQDKKIEEIDKEVEELELLTDVKKEEEPIKGVRIEEIEGLFQTHSRIPTHTPRNFKEQKVLWSNDTNYRKYDYIGDGWKKTFDDTDWTDLTDGGATTLHTHALNVAVGKTTKTSVSGTGSQAITGLGFRPTMVKITASKLGADAISHGHSTTEGTGNVFYFSDNLNNWQQDLTKIIVVEDATPNVGYAVLRSFDADGFSLTWTQIDIDVDFLYEAFG